MDSTGLLSNAAMPIYSTPSPSVTEVIAAAANAFVPLEVDVVPFFQPSMTSVSIGQ